MMKSFIRLYGYGLCACVILQCLAAGPEAARADVADISVREAHKRAQAGEIILIDVRAPYEWRQSGVPASSRAITMYQSGENFIRKLKKAAGNDPGKPIALICATGVRSLILQRGLRRVGVKNTINVLGGMFGTSKDIGWRKAKLPLRKWKPDG